jgi:hypothetical protein
MAWSARVGVGAAEAVGVAGRWLAVDQRSRHSNHQGDCCMELLSGVDSPATGLD